MYKELSTYESQRQESLCKLLTTVPEIHFPKDLDMEVLNRKLFGKIKGENCVENI